MSLFFTNTIRQQNQFPFQNQNGIQENGDFHISDARRGIYRLLIYIYIVVVIVACECCVIVPEHMKQILYPHTKSKNGQIEVNK